ncbi:hypothetical protein J3Q64DRAFT_1748756, partial [Phycomyces blakesleeanus]
MNDVNTVSGKNLDKISFDHFKAGLGRGSIDLKGLKGGRIHLGTLDGSIKGEYEPSKEFIAGSLRGPTAVKILQKENSTAVKIAVRALDGSAIVQLPADTYEGNFVAVSGPGNGSPVVNATKPEDVHVTKLRHFLKKGYYKTDNTGSDAFVRSEHGHTILGF